MPGVYIFRSKHAAWFKLGHTGRPTPYGRISPQGFHGCRHPRELDGHLNEGDFELEAWYPTLGVLDELWAHQQMRSEFYPMSELPKATGLLQSRGAAATVLSARDRAQREARQQADGLAAREAPALTRCTEAEARAQESASRVAALEQAARDGRRERERERERERARAILAGWSLSDSSEDALSICRFHAPLLRRASSARAS